MYCKISIAVLLVIASVSTTQAQLNNTQRGALTGGAAGAVIGGIIGNQNDETPEGALICLLYTSPSPRDRQKSRMPSSA